MTREEYMKKLADIQTDISAYKQEPSGDLISRQAVMDCFKKWQPYMATRLWDFEQELSALPSVSPQPCEDAISRQALLKLMGEEPFNWTDSNQELQAVEDYRNFRNMVEQLPSVNPQHSGDLISRQAVLDLCDKSTKYDIPFEYYEGKKHIRGWDIGRIINMNKLIELPSVKPQEKTGHWQHYEGMLICSECGTEFYDDIMEYCGDDVPKYCPNCGYNMVGPQKDEKINCKATKCENCKNHNSCDYESQESED